MATGLNSEIGIGDLAPEPEPEEMVNDSKPEPEKLVLTDPEDILEDESEQVSADDIPFEVNGEKHVPSQETREQKHFVLEDAPVEAEQERENGRKKKGWVQSTIGGLFETKNKNQYNNNSYILIMRLEEDLIDFNLPEADNSIITVIGVGGGGSNAVNRMFQRGIRDVNFFVANTDAQSLAKSQVPVKVHLGETLTEGRGAGNKAEIGKQAAVESSARIRECIKPVTRMAFIVAGMGGGTGSGATPVIAGMCRDLGILTVGVVTLPFRFEGPVRMKQAISGIKALQNEVDSLLIIHNEKLREIYGNLTLSNAFANADNILMLAVKGIAEIITIHGYVNVDFADVKSIMSQGGIAFMGSASAGGQDRANKVIMDTINSPLLNNNDIKGAKRVLLNITSGKMV